MANKLKKARINLKKWKNPINKATCRALLLGGLSLVTLSGCMTMSSSKEEKLRQEKLVQTQKSLIVSFLNKGMVSLALKELRGHIKARPKDPDFQNLMGLTFMALKTPNKSISYFKKAIALDDKISYNLNLGSAYIETKQLHKALKQFVKIKKSRAYVSYKHQERVIHNIALTTERLGRHRTAEKYYKRALNQNPNFYMSLMRLGKMKEQAKRFREAHKYYKRAHGLCTECFDPVGGIARSLMGLKKPSLAIKALGGYLRNKNTRKEDQNRAKKLIKSAAAYSHRIKHF